MNRLAVVGGALDSRLYSHSKAAILERENKVAKIDRGFGGRDPSFSRSLHLLRDS